MRENRTHGSEGGEAKAFPTPIEKAAAMMRKVQRVELPSESSRQTPGGWPGTHLEWTIPSFPLYCEPCVGEFNRTPRHDETGELQ